MKLLFLIIIITLGLTLLFKNKKPKALESKSLKNQIASAFKKYYVIEKNNKIMICEQDTKGFIKELVYISVNPNQPKSIRRSGSYYIATYPKTPSIREVKNDFSSFLN